MHVARLNFNLLEGQHITVAISTPLFMNHVFSSLHLAVLMHFGQSPTY